MPDTWTTRAVAPDEALACVQSGMRIVVHGAAATREHVHWVVTEYGAVDLFGKSLRERAESLIAIAHPNFHADLRRAYAETRHLDLTSPGAS